jgi:hypothetical protein
MVWADCLGTPRYSALNRPMCGQSHRFRYVGLWKTRVASWRRPEEFHSEALVEPHVKLPSRPLSVRDNLDEQIARRLV